MKRLLRKLPEVVSGARFGRASEASGKRGAGTVRRAAAALLLAAAALFALAGCGFEKEADVTTLFVDKEGVLTQLLIEPLEDGSYTQSDLTAYINYEVDSYNKEHGEDSIIREESSISGRFVTIRLTYASAEDYARFNQVPCFQGTLAEAQAEGYSFNATFLNKDNASLKGVVVLEEDPEYKILIIQEPGQIKVDGTIMYVSEEVTILDQSTAEIPPVESTYSLSMTAALTEKPLYIIYK